MSTEHNRALVRRFFDEVLNAGNLAVVDELFAPTVVINGRPGSIQAVKQIATRWRTAFPDIQVTIDDQVAEGDHVSTRRTLRGTHRGVWESPLGAIAPTLRPVSWTMISIVRIAEGKIVEDWVAGDLLGLLQQLGAQLTPGPVD